VVEYQMWTTEWDSLKAVRKWKDYPLYSTAHKGHIGLQDHGKKTWFRNIKIRTL
jgi:heme-degrading monooxygenase HmoA